MADTNKFGLRRSVPNDVQRQVRQRDGFGCVICGLAIYQYEHFDPEFAEAKEHKIDGMCLLCIRCHGKKTKGLLSTQTVKRAVANPKCKQKGFSWEMFDVGLEHPLVALGNFTAYKVKTLIQIGDEEIFSILPPEQPGTPYRINARLFDNHGILILQILENQWQTSTDNWDVQQVGQRLTISRGPGDIILCLRSEPPNRLIVERLDMCHRGTTIRAREGRDTVIESNGSTFSTYECQCNECDIGIHVIRPGSFMIGVRCKSGSATNLTAFVPV